MALGGVPGGAGAVVGDVGWVVVLWDLADRHAPRRIGDPLPTDTGEVFSTAFSPDGATLAAGTEDDGTVTLWDLADRHAPRRIGDPLDAAAEVGSLAFSPDGAILAAGALGGGPLALWDLTDLSALRAGLSAQACRRAGRGLTPQEWVRHIPHPPYEDTCAVRAG
jgi:hypothetical protein